MSTPVELPGPVAMDVESLGRLARAVDFTGGTCGLYLQPADSELFRRAAEALRALNTPEVLDFIKGVQFEAAHQRERWGTDHDAGKTDADWFWLVGYLAGKALHKPEKRLHHLITCAAALANWHLYSLGKTSMRPGIAPPEDSSKKETP